MRNVTGVLLRTNVIITDGKGDGRLVSSPPKLMESYPVSTTVNSPKNEGRENIEPLAV